MSVMHQYVQVPSDSKKSAPKASLRLGEKDSRQSGSFLRFRATAPPADSRCATAVNSTKGDGWDDESWAEEKDAGIPEVRFAAMF